MRDTAKKNVWLKQGPFSSFADAQIQNGGFNVHYL